MNKRNIWLILIFSIILNNILYSNTNSYLFEWKFKVKKAFTVDKYTEQTIIKNGNKIAIRELKDYVSLIPTSFEDNFFNLRGTYYSYVREKGGVYRLDKVYPLNFFMNKNGEYKVPKEYIMPTIRNIPTFPSNPIKVGDTWSAKGVEVLEFHPSITLPVNVNYQFVGFETKFNKKLAKIVYNYLWNHIVDHNYQDIPYKFIGASYSTLWYDLKEGLPVYVENKYDLGMIYKNGTTIQYKGDLYGYYNLKSPENIIKKKQNELYKKLKKDKIDVKKEGNNVIINLGEVYFKYNKSDLTEKAKKKLKKIGKALKKYKKYSILIKGHTDNIGSESYNKELSEKRAKNVLKFLIENNYIDAKKSSYKGMGDTEPVANNSTEKGRSKNRRVEIIITPE